MRLNPSQQLVSRPEAAARRPYAGQRQRPRLAASTVNPCTPSARSRLPAGGKSESAALGASQGASRAIAARDVQTCHM